MVENTQDMILPLLHQMNGKLTRIEQRLDNLEDGQRSMNVRMTNLERGVSEVNHRLDTFHVRLERIEKIQHLTENSLMEQSADFEGPDA